MYTLRTIFDTLSGLLSHLPHAVLFAILAVVIFGIGYHGFKALGD